MASCTADASACTRGSMAVLAAGAVITCHPRSFTKLCHCAASLESMSAMAGVLPVGAPGTAKVGGSCAKRRPHPRLIMAHARADLLDEFFDIIRFFQSGHGQDVAIVLLQVLLQLFGKLHQLRRVLQVLFLLGLQDFIALQLTVGQTHTVFV